MEERKKTIRQFAMMALSEDVGDGDHTSLACIDPDDKSRAKLLVKEEGVLAGMEVAEEIFRLVDDDAIFEKKLEDGADISYGDIAFYVTCNSQALLKAERLVLNVMQRMSGIASMSRLYAEEVKDYKVKVLDTRKTTPLLRFFEKWAVKIGGCENYRVGLYDWIMIKDNHVEASGGVRAAIGKVHKYLERTGRNLDITVEVRNKEELNDALEEGGVRRIMLDNFTPEEIVEALRIIDGRHEVEASGGITKANLKEYAATGVDYISVGALTHSVKSLDLSLKIVED